MICFVLGWMRCELKIKYLGYGGAVGGTGVVRCNLALCPGFETPCVLEDKVC